MSDVSELQVRSTVYTIKDTVARDTKVDKNQGTQYAGKFLRVNENGIVAPYSSSVNEIPFANVTGQPTDNTNLATALNAKVDVSQGTSKAGSVMVVDDNGSVVAGNPRWGSIIGTISNQNDLVSALNERMAVQYTSQEDGYIAKVDSADHKLKVVPGGTSTISFADITGDPYDNTNLATTLDGKVAKAIPEEDVTLGVDALGLYVMLGA